MRNENYRDTGRFSALEQLAAGNQPFVDPQSCLSAGDTRG